MYVCVYVVNIFKHLLLWNHWTDWSQIYVCVYVVNIFKHLLRNYWAYWSKISYGASLGWGNESLFKCPGHMTKMATMPIYGKNLKKSSLEPKGRWPWNLVCSIGCSNDDTGLTLTYFTARSDLVPYGFISEKGKTMNFSETIVVYDVKVGRCS